MPYYASHRHICILLLILMHPPCLLNTVTMYDLPAVRTGLPCDFSKHNNCDQKSQLLAHYLKLSTAKISCKNSIYISSFTDIVEKSILTKYSGQGHQAQCSVSSQVLPTVFTKSASVTCFPLEKYPAAIFASISTRESGGMR